MTDDADASNDTPTATGRRSQRPALLVIGAIGLLVLGAAVGLLLALPLRDDAPATPAADSVDVGFAQDMSVHHSQAVEMSAIALTGTSDPGVRSLAYDILTTQQEQLGRMQAWLSLWGQPGMPSGGYMAWMTEPSGDAHSGHGDAHDSGDMHHSGPTDSMPGMASSADMAALRQATGTEADVLFLQLMLRHHEGGLPMMQYGAQYASVGDVRDLAQTMVDTQEGESRLMTDMLAQRGAQPLPVN
ncbi:DUF305 domain-containing protein [Rhodococcus sp. HNM0569]|uniref:DUF305 domain-containing protein n=1 Tax=Rhodococcus sp. HNM0569 TaxID=2716340 RepID=UPI00146A344E|nr:DUF305 domain-containing protein [Rhodococcus sp. HNM0569]NLU84447.1 DUF305 domain-containing protein [Rhodococcus sp. HNM0569]